MDGKLKGDLPEKAKPDTETRNTEDPENEEEYRESKLKIILYSVVFAAIIILVVYAVYLFLMWDLRAEIMNLK
ncbi:MAG: hypothetical protein LUG24_06850 [Clostridiales bacterium]|nr:hypothetical protein [Clostridiales bacterium]